MYSGSWTIGTIKSIITQNRVTIEYDYEANTSKKGTLHEILWNNFDALPGCIVNNIFKDTTDSDSESLDDEEDEAKINQQKNIQH